MVQDAWHIGSHKRLAVAHADHHRRTQPRGHNLVRLRCRKNSQRKGSGEPLHRAPHRRLQRNRLARRLRIHLNLLDEVGNDFGIGLGDEPVALADQLVLQLEIVLHNAVVDHHNPPRAVAVRVGILFRRPSVRGPARVADAEGAIHRMLAQNLFQVAQLARSAPHLERRA